MLARFQTPHRGYQFASAEDDRMFFTRLLDEHRMETVRVSKGDACDVLQRAVDRCMETIGRIYKHSRPEPPSTIFAMMLMDGHERRRDERIRGYDKEAGRVGSEYGGYRHELDDECRLTLGYCEEYVCMPIADFVVRRIAGGIRWNGSDMPVEEYMARYAFIDLADVASMTK